MMTRCNVQQQKEVMSSVGFTGGMDMERKHRGVGGYFGGGGGGYWGGENLHLLG